MANLELVNYLQEGVNRGVSISQLKDNLLKQGFNGYEIDEAAEFVGKNSLGHNTNLFHRFKRIVFWVFILLFLAIIVILVLKVFSSDSVNVSFKNSNDSINFLMKQDTLVINFQDVKTILSLVSVGKKSIVFDLNNTPEVVNSNKSRPFDLNHDGVKETVIGFSGLENNHPILTFSNYSKCIEEWTCGDWGKCQDGSKRRACHDINSCGSVREKPNTKASCTSLFNLPL